jgi:hypothetical protein
MKALFVVTISLCFLGSFASAKDVEVKTDLAEMPFYKAKRGDDLGVVWNSIQNVSGCAMVRVAESVHTTAEFIVAYNRLLLPHHASDKEVIRCPIQMVGAWEKAAVEVGCPSLVESRRIAEKKSWPGSALIQDTETGLFRVVGPAR